MSRIDEQILVSGEERRPPFERVAKAVRESVRESGSSHVMKVLYLDDAGNPVGEWASSQIPESPWTGQMEGMQEPPYRLEQLLYLAETHPVHAAALDQKSADIVGKGWEWKAKNPDQADEGARVELESWFQGLSPDDVDMQELLSAVWLDVETIGWGIFELARDPQGVVRRLYHVPGHTVRAHRDGFRLAQIRDRRKVWFKRWGAVEVDGTPVQVDARTGSKTNVRTPANDLFVIKRPSRRSTWYGIPSYVSAVGWITLALAARDDNLLFFANRREPRWAIILTGLSDDTDLEEDLRRAFTVDLRQPYRNIVVPLAGPGKVEFQKLSDTAKDGSFEKLSERADKAIMIAHRVPAERLANAEIGPLGGNSTVAVNRIYKDAVVTPGQELANSRLNRFIDVEYEIATGEAPTWSIMMDDLDISSEREEIDLAVIAFHGDLITLREARHRLRLGPLQQPGEPDPETGEPGQDEESPLNDKLFTELPGVGQGGAGSPAGRVPGTGSLTGALASRDPALALLDADVRELLSSSRNVHQRIEEMAETAEADRRRTARDTDRLNDGT